MGQAARGRAVPARAAEQQALIRQQLEKEWRGLTGSAGTDRLERWLDLFEQVSAGWPTLLEAKAELIGAGPAHRTAPRPWRRPCG